jgi:hypothetical protein
LAAEGRAALAAPGWPGCGDVMERWTGAVWVGAVLVGGGAL